MIPISSFSLHGDSRQSKKKQQQQTSSRHHRRQQQEEETAGAHHPRHPGTNMPTTSSSLLLSASSIAGTSQESNQSLTSSSSLTMDNTTSISMISPEDKMILDEFFNGSIFNDVTESLIIMVFSILITTGFLFNTIMIIVILSSEKLRRMPFNLLLLNLCVSNILLSIFCMPFTLLGLIRRGWFFGPALCKIIPSLQVCFLVLSITSFSFPQMTLLALLNDVLRRTLSPLMFSLTPDDSLLSSFSFLFLLPH